MIEEWKSYGRYTKTVLTIYLILSLPLLPVMVPMILFAFWVTAPQGIPRRKMTLTELISFAFTMSLFVYIAAACVHWCK
jgi:hypothetical protein